MSVFWPAWAGGAALGTITVGYYVTVGRTLGVSGAWDRVLHWREEREAELSDEQFDADAFAAALEAATLEEFGADDFSAGAISAEWNGATTTSVATMLLDDEDSSQAHEPTDHEPEAATPAVVSRPVPLVAQAAFLLSVFVGGLIAAVSSGRFHLRGDMGPDFANIVTHGWLMWPTLFLGGLLVGFGTRLAGGCSSGHGLSGCGRLQPASIVATATFFGTAVAVSFLLWKVI